MNPRSSDLKLRIVRYSHGGKPYTAFVALKDDEYSDVVAAGTGDLTAYGDRIVLVAEEHDPETSVIEGVRNAFRRIFTNARGPAPLPEASAEE